MRKIEFRALDLSGEEWHVGLPSYDSDGDYVFTNDGGWDCCVDFETLGQYTGLKDKNGVEIYEGDIVLCYPDSIEFCYLKAVEWASDRPDLGITTNGRSGAVLCDSNKDILLVVGNIHQNKEMMK